MNTTSKHIPFAELADLAEKRASAEKQTSSQAHMSTCAACAQQLDRLQQVLTLMRTDTAADAPRDVLAFAVNIFTARKDSHQPSLLRRLVAALSFDSSSDLMPAFGVRSGQAISRQLLYSAEETDIDLRITPQDQGWIVAGQVLGGECVGGRIEIEGEDELTTAELNELCEFALPPLAAGTYKLRLRLGNSEIEIPQLELRA